MIDCDQTQDKEILIQSFEQTVVGSSIRHQYHVILMISSLLTDSKSSQFHRINYGKLLNQQDFLDRKSS